MKKTLSVILALSLLLTLCGCRRLLLQKKDPAPGENAVTESVISVPQDQLVDVTSKPSQAPSAPQLPAWKTAYKNYINQIDPNEYEEFALIYIDEDNIPELYVMGTCEAAGELLCTYADGVVKDKIYGRIGGLSYAARTGRYKHFNGNMGMYALSLCTLKNGVFTTVISGTQEEDMEHYDPDTGDIPYLYTLEGEPVTEESFNKTIANWEGSNAYIRMADLACSKGEILSQLS
jgi:hypothetical protein